MAATVPACKGGQWRGRRRFDELWEKYQVEKDGLGVWRSGEDDSLGGSHTGAGGRPAWAEGCFT